MFQWDLVCDRDWLAELSITIEALGWAICSLVFTRLADAIGRKPAFLGCLWASLLMKFIQTFSVNLTMYIVFGFMNGFTEQV